MIRGNQKSRCQITKMNRWPRPRPTPLKTMLSNCLENYSRCQNIYEKFVNQGFRPMKDGYKRMGIGEIIRRIYAISIHIFSKHIYNCYLTIGLL